MPSAPFHSFTAAEMSLNRNYLVRRLLHPQMNMKPFLVIVPEEKVDPEEATLLVFPEKQTCGAAGGHATYGPSPVADRSC